MDLAARATAAYERPDLAERAERARARLTDPRVRVLVVGEFKQGKSQLINALVAAPVCPVDDDVATSVPTVVRRAESPSLTLVRRHREEDAGEAGASEERTEVALEELGRYVSEKGNPANRDGLSYAEVGIPRGILSDGLELVDTPGVGGLGSVHGSATMAVLPTADAVLLVSDASAEYSGTELEFLRQALKLCPNVACVLTKTDLYPEWRRMAELDRGHLAAAEVAARVIPVSSTLRLHAARGGDPALAAESGFPALVGFLRERVVGQSERLAERAAANDVLGITESLAGHMRAELEVCEDPARAEALTGELEAAKTRAVALGDRSARWNQTLSDGIADLTSDIDYDLRDRMRQLVREAEELLEAIKKPASVWEEFAEQVQQRAAAAAAANFVWANERVRWLAEQVADHFSAEGERVAPEPQIGNPDLASSVPDMRLPAGERFGIGQQAFVGVRGGYIGTLMAGMFSTFAGMALLNPFSAGAGVLLGGKTWRDEKRRVTERKRAEMLQAARRYSDDVLFQIGKESRDVLRRVQRELRDHFTGQAEELSRSLAASVQAAEKAVRAGADERSRRAADLRAELERVAALEARARGLVLPAEPARGDAAGSDEPAA